jgi:ABC-type transporter MlaC component
MLTRRSLLAGIMLLSAPAAWAQTPLDVEARSFIDAMIRELSAVDARGLSEPARSQALDEVLKKRVALSRIARFMLGASRTRATPAELADYDRLAPAFILQDVRAEIAKLVAQSIAIDTVELRSESDALVRSRFRRKSGGLVRVDWRVQRSGEGRLSLVDVYVNGVSRFVLRRDEFQSLVKTDGMPALLERLRQGPS